MKMNFELVKSQFFDKAVTDHLAPKVKRVLSRFGAYTRRSARSLVRRKGSKRNPSSKPGQPPFSPTGTLRRTIFFYYDKREQSVTIGPVLLRKSYFQDDGKPVNDTVPSVLEFGGTINLREVQTARPVSSSRTRDRRGRFKRDVAWKHVWVRASRKYRKSQAGKKRRLRKVAIQERPFMGPAYDANLSKLRDWKANL